MIRHEAEAEQFDMCLRLAIEQELQECTVVPRLAEDPHSAVAAVQNVIDDAADSGPSSSRHEQKPTARAAEVKFDGCHLCSVPNNPSASEAVSTIVHESSHVDRAIRLNIEPGSTQYEEYLAFRREALYRLGRRPNLAERARIWSVVKLFYPHLPEQ